MFKRKPSYKSTQKYIHAGGDNAGRDNIKTINIFVVTDQTDFQALIQALNDTTNLDKGYVKNEIGKYEEGIKAIRSAFEAIDTTNTLKESFTGPTINDIKDRYENIVMGNNQPLNNTGTQLMLEGGSLVREHEFGEAHDIFKRALKGLTATSEHYKKLLKEFLISGFIHYSQQNDMKGLKSLIDQKTRKIPDDAEINCIITNIFQEICSRETNIRNLNQFLFKIQDLYDDSTGANKALMANSLGLAYRRLGERGNVELLEKAISIFREGLKSNKNNATMEVELKDQMAITYVRIFEFTKEKSNLVDAEKLLNECISLFKYIKDPRNYRIKPRVLNNKGNVFKQLALNYNDEKSAHEAISCYVMAEEFWDETTAKYEWALLQKNKAEARYALAKMTRNKDLSKKALADCISSVKYRTLKNSPYQWGKSVDIIFSIIILLGELEGLNMINESTRAKIASYIKAIEKEESQWTDATFINFIANAKHTRILLTQ